MGTNRLTGTLAAVALLAAVGSAARAATWTSINWGQGTANTYNWNNTNNWTGGVVPNSDAVEAVFTASSGFLDSGAFAVNVDVPITVAGIYTTGSTSSATITFSGDDLTFNNSTTSNGNQTLIEALQIPLVFDNNIVNNDPDGLAILPYKNITVNGSLTSSSGIYLTTGNLYLNSTSNSINGVTMSSHSGATLIAMNTGAFNGITGTLTFDATYGGHVESHVVGTTTFSAALDLNNSAGTVEFDPNVAGDILNLTTSSITNSATGGVIEIYSNGYAAAIVEFSGTDFTIGKEVDLTRGTIELAPANGTQIWTGDFTPNASTNGGGIIKDGGGTVILSGTNSYAPQTHITGGTLLVNGTHSFTTTYGAAWSGATNGNYLVDSGATLGGTGRIAIYANYSNTAVNAILVNSGGFIAPGTPGSNNGIGTLTLDAANFKPTGSGTHNYLNMASGSAFDFDLDGSGGTPDQIDLWNYVNGNLGLNANALNLDLVGAQAPGTYTVSLFKFFGNSGSTAAASDISSGLVLGTLGAGITSASIIYDNNSGDTIDVRYTVAAVPEPASLGLLAIGGALMLLRRRKA